MRRIESVRDGARIELAAKRVLEDVQLGDSIAVNGVCLTVTTFTSNAFTADAVPETMRRTNLGRLRPGARVNLERALRVGDRLGGHLVSGHVDGVGILKDRVPEGNAVVLSVAAPPALARYIAEKGSICIDGVSLTVMDVQESTFRVSIIPHTGLATTLLTVPVGAEVNLECDVIAKYVERLLGLDTSSRPHTVRADVASPDGGGGMNLEFLRENGFI